jgi:hypothetical protein
VKPKKKTVDSFLENDDGTFVQITQVEYDEIRGYAKNLVKQAESADDLVTSQIKGIADDVKAAFPDAPIIKDGPDVFQGSLHWRMKDLDSTSRKIQTYARDKNLTFAEAQSAISDSLRYTYIVDDADYISAVRATMEKFAELGYKNGKFDAAWFYRKDYRGLNINMITPEGVKMELQFHTAKSFEIKNGINHELYEKFRKLSTAKQKGPEGQALNAAMEANAKTIPMPPNIKELDELAKIYNKPNPAAQAKILEDAAKATTKQLEFDEALKKAQAKLADAKAFAKKAEDEARAATQVSKAQKDFEIKLNQHLDEGNIGKAVIDIGKNLDLPDDVLKIANERVAALRAAQTKKVDDVINELKKINEQDEFANAIKSAKAAAEPGIQQQLSDAGNELFKAKMRGDFAITNIAKNIEAGDLEGARIWISELSSIPERKFQTLRVIKLEKAALDEAKSVFGLLDGLEVKTQAEYANWVKSIRPGIKTKAGDKEFMKLVNEGEKKVKNRIAINDAQLAIDKGDLGEAKQLLADATGPEVEKMSLKIGNLRIEIAGEAKKMVDDMSELFTTPDALEQAVMIAIKEAKPTFALFAENHLTLAMENMATKVQQQIASFAGKALNKAKELGFSKADVGLLNTSLDDLAVLMNGKIDDAFVESLRKQLGDGRTLLRTAQDKIKALNNASKGVDAITAHANSLPTGVSSHPEFQAAIKKVVKQAQKKASAARKEVVNQMLWKGDIDTDGIIKFKDTILKDALADVNKKLGPKQLEAKIKEINAKISKAKDDVLNFVSDSTDYDDAVLKIFEGEGVQQKKLNEAIQMFKVNGDDAQARSKLFDLLVGKTPKETRAIKEFIHKRVNPKTLPNGQNWDSAVADIVTRHANNANAADIQKYINLLTDDLTDGMKTNFNQTVLTRSGVKSIDDLGVIPEGQATPAVERIRAELARKDPGNVPLPVHTLDEQIAGAKRWLGGADRDHEKWLKSQKASSDDQISISRRQFREGESRFGRGAWGVSKDEWDDWIKNVYPTLDEWEVAIVDRYTGGMASEINKGLYNGGMDRLYTGGAQALNKALDKFPKHTGKVYRGTSPRENWSADLVDARYQVGETVTERGFGSSATQESASFSGDIRFVIVTKGQNGAIMGHVGGFGAGEMEVLFKAGSKFRVLRKRRDGNKITVTMEEAGP